jgi:glucose/arabinose dehydrogenase
MKKQTSTPHCVIRQRVRFSKFLSALLLAGLALVGARADLDKLPPGYSITLVSSNVNVSSISQLAFRPGDLTHVYAVRSQGASSKISRYDYDPVTGLLANEFTPVANADSKEMIGLGFHGTNLYVTFDYGGSRTVRPGDGRIARFQDPDGDGFFQVRHDIVHSVNKGDHDVEQIQFKGDSLYVSIGAVGRNGNPAQENIYSMTVAFIEDINQVLTEPDQIGANFKGPINYLASPTEWTNAAGASHLLRNFASGFRNPFGIAFDPEGDLWVTVNGNSDTGFFSDDYLYKKVQYGDEGEFPPPEFGFTKYISGNPITNLVNFGISPSPAGLDFIRDGPDAGKVLVARLGATRTNWLGRDLVLVDPDTGDWEQIYQFATNTSAYAACDVVRDPYGRFLISDLGHNNVWLLRTPLPAPELEADLDHGQLELSWPLIAVEYALEQSLDATTGSWSSVGIGPEIRTNGIFLHLPATNSARFYRLKR